MIGQLKNTEGKIEQIDLNQLVELGAGTVFYVHNVYPQQLCVVTALTKGVGRRFDGLRYQSLLPHATMAPTTPRPAEETPEATQKWIDTLTPHIGVWGCEIKLTTSNANFAKFYHVKDPEWLLNEMTKGYAEIIQRLADQAKEKSCAS